MNDAAFDSTITYTIVYIILRCLDENDLGTEIDRHRMMLLVNHEN